MKVQSYNVNSQSEHYLEKTSFSYQRLEAWGKEGRELAQTFLDEEDAAVLELSVKDDMRQQLSGLDKSAKLKEKSSCPNEYELKFSLLEAFIFMLTGKRTKLRLPSMEQKDENLSQNIMAESQPAADIRVGWGIAFDSIESYVETEALRFSSEGNVTTADGRSISFNMEFMLSRSYYEASSLSLRLGDAKLVDPLLVAFNGGAPSLTKEKYDFDLDGDGKSERISFAGPGSGFLALDKNKDGKINDGTELFGPNSGNGFSELRAYDIDNNGWIDEGDPVFELLSLLTVNERGEMLLLKLADVGIGAIYLNDTNTAFDFKDGMTSNGILRSSSIFLRENGTAGSLHHVDLSV